MEAGAPPPPAPPPAAAPPPAPRAGRVDVGRVISETFAIYAKHAVVLILLAVVIFGVVGIINAFLYDEGGILFNLIIQVLNLLASAIYAGMVVRVVQHHRAGTAATIGETFESVTPVLGILILNGILKGIAVTIGFFLLIIPGIFLATIWSVTSPSIVVERSGIIDAFGRSWELVKDDFWPVLGAFVIAYLILIAAGFIGLIIGISIGIAGLIIFGILFSALAAPVVGIVSAVLFFDLGGGQAAAAPPAAPAAPPPAPAA